MSEEIKEEALENQEEVESNTTEDEISVYEYRSNILKLAIMWSQVSFCTYAILFLNKYFEGTIFVNFLLEGTSGLIAVVLAIPIYDTLKIRGAFIFSHGLTLLGACLVLAFEEHLIDPSFVVNLGLSD